MILTTPDPHPDHYSIALEPTLWSTMFQLSSTEKGIDESKDRVLQTVLLSIFADELFT
jgi:hypothetical protein